MPTVHLIIKGKVQGVFFRVAAKEKADSLGITGWVKNTEDGAVEITASGAAEAVKKLVEWCRTGPENAQVEDVIIQSRSGSSFKKFSIKR